MFSKLKIGVIGYGKLGSVHASNVDSSEKGHLYAVCDASLEALAKAKDKFPDIRTFSSVKEMLLESIDAVVIASSTPLHLEHIEMAAKAGKHIFTEKPVGLSLEDTDRVLKAVTDADVQFQIGFQRRWDPRFLAAKDMIESGKIGRPVLIKAYGRDPDASNPANWGLDKNGGLFLNAAIHDYDAARFLLDLEASSISAEGAALVHEGLKDVDDIDTCSTAIKFGENKAMVITEWSRYARYGYDIGFEIIGTDGMIRMGREQSSTLSLLQVNDDAPVVFDVFSDAYKGEVDAFINNVCSGKPVSPGIEDARTALYIAIKARESYSSGTRLLLPPLEPLA